MSLVAKRIDGIVRSALAPFLKEVGFKKKGSSFYKTDDSSMDVINVQLSQGNFGDEGRFTLNVGKYFPAIAELEGESAALEFPKEYECTLRKRIGDLMPQKADFWWQISRASDDDALAADVKSAVERYALPWLQALDSYAKVRAELAVFPSLRAASVEVLLNERAAAIAILQALIQERPHGNAHVRAWAKLHQLTLD